MKRIKLNLQNLRPISQFLNYNTLIWENLGVNSFLIDFFVDLFLTFCVGIHSSGRGLLTETERCEKQLRQLEVLGDDILDVIRPFHSFCGC